MAMILVPLVPADKAWFGHCNNCGHSTDHFLEFCKADFNKDNIHLILTCSKCKDDPHAFKRHIDLKLGL